MLESYYYNGKKQSTKNGVLARNKNNFSTVFFVEKLNKTRTKYFKFCSVESPTEKIVSGKKQQKKDYRGKPIGTHHFIGRNTTASFGKSIAKALGMKGGSP